MTSQERAKRNEVLSLLTSADGEFNEAEAGIEMKMEMSTSAHGLLHIPRCFHSSTLFQRRILTHQCMT